MLVEECSKDGKNWIVFAKFCIPVDSLVFPSEEYWLHNYRVIREGFVHWRHQN